VDVEVGLGEGEEVAHPQAFRACSVEGAYLASTTLSMADTML
jgi:hypothetical protein